MCTDNGFSGCFDTTPCFPNSLVVNLVKEFRTQSAQNPSEKHFACVKSPGFLRTCDLLYGIYDDGSGFPERVVLRVRA